MPQVSVVILNFNGAGFLREFLPSVIRFSTGAELIVIDNGSNDDSLELLKGEFPAVRVIELPENLGFTGGYNRGLQEVESKYFILLNSDVEVTSNWIKPIIEFMEQDPQIVACQPKILSQSARNTFEYAGAGGGFIDYLGYPFCRGRLFTTLEQDCGQFDDIADVFWASGACLFIRSKIFWSMNGFDERFFAHMEEIDLCWRIRRAGYKICYNGKSTVYHHGGGTLHKSNPRKTYLNFKNSITMLYQNSDSRNLSSKLAARICLDIFASLKFLIFDSWEDCKAVIRADFEFLRDIKKNKMLRKQLWKQSKNIEIPEIYSKSVVLDYYFRGRKFFGDLNF